MKGAIVFDIETSGGKGKDQDLTVLGFYDYDTNEYYAYTIDEIDKAWELLNKRQILIGFNSNKFDIPILNRYCPIDLTKMKSIDILEDVRISLNRRIKLDSIAKGTLENIKKSGTGLDAIEWWENKEYEKVKKYCVDDVKITKKIFEYMNAYKEFKYEDFGVIKVANIDTAKWDEKVKRTIEQSSVPLF